MSINIGDKVSFKRSEASITHPESWGICFIHTLQSKNVDMRKGVVTKIKKRYWLFFKLEDPIYIIDDYYMVSKVKPVVKKYASLRKIFSEGSKLESVWELNVS